MAATDMARQAKIALLGVLVSLTRVGGPMVVKFDCSASQATRGRARVRPSTCSDLSRQDAMERPDT